MIPFQNALSIATAEGKTFADWVAHATARVPPTVAPNSNISYGPGARWFRVVHGTGTAGKNGGYGSPWQYYYAGTFEAVLWHSMLSEAAVNEQKANGGVLIYGVEGIFELEYLASITRNTVTTGGYDLPGNPGSFYRVVEASFWDFTLNKARTINPWAGSGPVDYSNAGWTP